MVENYFFLTYFTKPSKNIQLPVYIQHNYLCNNTHTHTHTHVFRIIRNKIFYFILEHDHGSNLPTNDTFLETVCK